MIYILAPFSLDLNTTSKNRILSFYRGLKEKGHDVRVLSPPKVPGSSRLYIHGSQSLEDSFNEDIVFLKPVDSIPEKIRRFLLQSSGPSFFWKILNLVYLLSEGTDLHYPSGPLEEYFVSQPLSEKDIILASGPPFSLFKAAAAVAKLHKCKLILDYRDPWTFGYRPVDTHPLVSFIKMLAGRKLERDCLNRSAVVTCNSKSVKMLFPEKDKEKVQVIRNGANLYAIDPQKIMERGEVFRIVYLGTIYYDQLIDETFFNCLNLFLDRNQIKGNFEIIFVGAAKNARLPKLIKKYKLEAFVRITERLSMKEAINIAYTASVFLHLKYRDCTEVDTSKNLDYLALQKPILLPVSDHGNAAHSILQHQAGYVCHNSGECYAALLELWEKHQRGESFKIPRSKEFLYSISREAEAEKLVALLAEEQGKLTKSEEFRKENDIKAI